LREDAQTVEEQAVITEEGMEKEKIDQMLCELDDFRIAEGRPILSVLVRFDDGAVCTAFWKSVEKHKLRLPGESDERLLIRLRDAAWADPGEVLGRK
jgi:hypothetical protein